MTTIANQPTENTGDNAIFTQFKHSRFLQLIALLLIAQLALAALLGFTNKQATFASGGALFTLNEDEVNSISISNNDETISLTKQSDAWQMDDDIPLPADSAQVQSLLSSMVNLKTGLPVASSVNAQAQLEVADDEHQRKLVINNDKTHTFLLGTSPGLRKAHLRREGSDDIYSVSLPVADVPTSKDQWLDKSLLAISDISQITSSAMTFERTGTDDSETWAVPANEDDSKALDTKKLMVSVQALETLQVTGLSDPSAQPSEGSEPSTTNSDATTQTDPTSAAEDKAKSETVKLQVSGESGEHKLVLNKTGDIATIERSDIDQVFAIPTTTYDELATLAAESDWLVDSEGLKDSQELVNSEEEKLDSNENKSTE